MEPLPDGESSQTENNHVFEDGNGRYDNTLAVEDNDGKVEQAPRYLQNERMKPGMYAYIARKGIEGNCPSLEESMQKTGENNWEQAIDQESKSLERNGTWERVYRQKVMKCFLAI